MKSHYEWHTHDIDAHTDHAHYDGTWIFLGICVPCLFILCIIFIIIGSQSKIKQTKTKRTLTVQSL